MTPPTAALVGVFVGFLTAAAVVPTPAGAASPGSPGAGPRRPTAEFGVRPEAGATSRATGPRFDWTIPPGRDASGAIVVSNLSPAPLTVAVYGADLLALGGAGGYAVSQRYQPTHGVGAWIRASPTVTVAAGQERSVPFEVEVPPSALPGDYGGAGVVEGPPTPGEGMSVETREAMEVLVRVPGARTTSARLGSLRVRRVDGEVLMSAVLRNTGTTAFGYRGEVVLEGASALRISLTTRPAAARLLPGQAVTLEAVWRHPPRRAVVTARARAEVAPAGGLGRAVEDPPVTLSFFPWLVVLLALLALGLLASVSRAARRCQVQDRRRKVRAGTPR